MSRTAKQPADYILPLYMNGLEGRMLRLPSQKVTRREILVVYGHHAMLERWFSLAENLAEFGNVTMPDLPGFGGMESFSKIGLKPNTDNFADYLAAFIKLRFKRKKVTIFAISYGFVVVTRMLQRYPELASKVDILISAVGFMHKDDISLNRPMKIFVRYIARVVATRPAALLFRYAFLNRFMLKNFYAHLPNSKRRMAEITPDEFEHLINVEVQLWQKNDARTHWLTFGEFLTINNCRQSIELPVVHVVSEEDHYLNDISVEQHMRGVFSKYRSFTARSKAHVPSVIADKTAMSVMVPVGLRKLLKKKV